MEKNNGNSKDLKSAYTLAQKIEIGLKRAWRKLVIETAAKNQSLVIKVNGEIKTVPAKDLLAELEK